MIESRTDIRAASEPVDTSDTPPLHPWDRYNQQWAAQVRPVDWRNPTPKKRYHLVVVGAGPAGLVAAAAAAGLGARVALIERGLLGGDCLNVGCVPSKALLRCARAAADARDAGRFGVATGPVRVDFPAIMERMRRLRAELSEHDAATRFQALGVDVFLGEGRFIGPRELSVAGATLRFSKALIATGSRAQIPPIKGLKSVDYLSNETLFSLTTLPKRLAIIGAGPIGCEMAQAFARFGATVTLIEAGPRILPQEDLEAAEIVAEALTSDGIKIHCNAKVAEIRAREQGALAEKTLLLILHGKIQELHVDQVLLSAGRTPQVEGLGLESVGVDHDLEQGVLVNDFLQSSNPRIYAAGDVCSSQRFTHAADAQARIVVRNALFWGRARAGKLLIPHCIYTDPEVASVGMSAQEAASREATMQSVRVPVASVDRAVLEGDTTGYLEVRVARKRGRILGATLVAPQAGDLISQVTALMQAGKGLAHLSSVIHPYPTRGEVLKKAGDAWMCGKLTPRVQKVLRFLLALQR